MASFFIDAVDPPWVADLCRNSPEEADDNEVDESTFMGSNCGTFAHDLTTIPNSGSLELRFNTEPFSTGDSWPIDPFGICSILYKLYQMYIGMLIALLLHNNNE